MYVSNELHFLVDVDKFHLSHIYFFSYLDFKLFQRSIPNIRYSRCKLSNKNIYYRGAGNPHWVKKVRKKMFQILTCIHVTTVFSVCFAMLSAEKIMISSDGIWCVVSIKQKVPFWLAGSPGIIYWIRYRRNKLFNFQCEPIYILYRHYFYKKLIKGDLWGNMVGCGRWRGGGRTNGLYCFIHDIQTQWNSFG